MLILFGQKYYGKDTSEVPSGFLIWIIEEYKNADWTLINACKLELSSRLKFDWTPPDSIDTKYLERISNQRDHITHLQNMIVMSLFKNWNYYMAEYYLHSPQLLKSDLKLIRNANQ